MIQQQQAKDLAVRTKALERLLTGVSGWPDGWLQQVGKQGSSAGYQASTEQAGRQASSSQPTCDDNSPRLRLDSDIYRLRVRRQPRIRHRLRRRRRCRGVLAVGEAAGGTASRAVPPLVPLQVLSGQEMLS
jgi:hypothetical protein